MNIQKLITKVVGLMAVAILYVASTASAVANQNDAVILYLNDPMGSAVAAYDENGDVCWEETHTPYGDKTVMEDSFNRASCGVVIEERGFTGHTDDYETDLVYMQQRYYDPTVGRFLSTDPVGINPSDVRTMNRYSYAANNPYKYTDPTGRIFETPWDVASVLVGVGSLIYNTAAGNHDAAKLDALGIAADTGSVLLPGIPAVGAISIKAGRAAEAATDVARTIDISRAKYGEAADHIADAQRAGHNDVLTIARDNAKLNRAEAIGGIPKVSGKQLDEYPPAMFKEGGAGASVRAINPGNNMGAGACIGNACRGLANGEKVRIRVVD